MPRAIIRKYSLEENQTKHIPRKRFGQHFLTDRNILEKIVRASKIASGDIVLEIGPGQGDLTRILAETGARVVAIEIDRDLHARLQTNFAEPNVTFLQGDILAQTPDAWLAQANCAPPYAVVANLPYYITSAILRYLLEAAARPTSITVMVQREVAQQITARAPHNNLLALSVQFYGTPQNVGTVPAGAFRPPPKVDSAIVHIQVNAAPPPVSPETFFRVARAGFGAKRKQLHNALSNGLHLTRAQSEWLLTRANIALTRRAETLTLPEWVELTRVFQETDSP